jgi:hypothetical protein
VSNPYIQFELDAAKKAPTLASALGVSVSVAFGGLTRMWLHVYTERVETVSSFYLRSFFEADPALVGEALVELGFALKVDASTWRVRGQVDTPGCPRTVERLVGRWQDHRRARCRTPSKRAFWPSSHQANTEHHRANTKQPVQAKP